ncbi:MAG: hypothetical protein HOP02_09280 [Methylococcaceae bacterium]|nr:hypothetical protein [Methylococcaceae bacterium]
MIKVLLKSVLVMTAFSGCVFADNVSDAMTNEQASSAEANTQAFMESIQAYRQQSAGDKLARAATTYYYNTEESKIKALYGKWQVTYQTPQTKTGTLEVDGTFVDTSFGYKGWDSKSNISCYYEPKMLGSIYSYQCLHVTDSATNTSERFLFNLNGNSLIGKYHSGTAADFITKLNANQLYDFTGTTQKCTDSCYSEATGELIIPKVSASGKNYSVIMQRESNGLFSLKSANPL